MNDEDFEMYDDAANETFHAPIPSSNDKDKDKGRLDKRRRLDDLLEAKRFRADWDDYDEYMQANGTHYDDDIFSDYTRSE